MVMATADGLLDGYLGAMANALEHLEFLVRLSMQKDDQFIRIGWKIYPIKP